MTKHDCGECNGKGEIPCPLQYYPGEPHPESCPVCGGDPNFTSPCPECSEYKYGY